MRLIDADALKDKVNDADYVPTWKWVSFSDLEALPTIEQKKGKWEDVQEDEWICFRCSECGHDAYSYTGEIMSNEWKFCPYCGASMERSEE